MTDVGSCGLQRPLFGSTALFAEEAHGTCPFYLKIGACRHGDQCSRRHIRPISSQTILISHLYPVPDEGVTIASDDLKWNDECYDVAQDHLEEFYDEVFTEFAKYGEIEDMIVADNISEHMMGNIYLKYFDENDAEKALKKLNGRYYAGRPIKAEFSPVTDFREARCRAFHEARCNRGGYCNFLHIKHIPRANKRRLVLEMYDQFPEYPHKRERIVKEKKYKKQQAAAAAAASAEASAAAMPADPYAAASWNGGYGAAPPPAGPSEWGGWGGQSNYGGFGGGHDGYVGGHHPGGGAYAGSGPSNSSSHGSAGVHKQDSKDSQTGSTSAEPNGFDRTYSQGWNCPPAGYAPEVGGHGEEYNKEDRKRSRDESHPDDWGSGGGGGKKKRSKREEHAPPGAWSGGDWSYGGGPNGW